MSEKRSMSETKTPEQTGGWWVCDGILPPRGNGRKIIGPFATQELALKVRTYVEKAEQRTDLWVDEDEQAQDGAGA